MKDGEMAVVVYDAIRARYSEKEILDPKKYDEICEYIRTTFDDAIMMQYINEGFTRPE